MSWFERIVMMEIEKNKEVEENDVIKYQPLVKTIAYKFINSGEPMEDLEQLGYIGLINALNLYNKQKNVKFETYASWFISGEIRHYIRDKHQSIKIPHWITELNRKINKFIVEYKTDTNEIPSLKKIAQEFNLSEEGVKEVLKARDVVHMVSIDQNNRGYDCNEYPILEKIKNDHYKNFKLPIEDLVSLEIALNKLKVLQQKVISCIFMKDLTQNKVAKTLSISQRQVSRIKNKALESLKEELKNDIS